MGIILVMAEIVRVTVMQVIRRVLLNPLEIRSDTGVNRRIDLHTDIIVGQDTP